MNFDDEFGRHIFPTFIAEFSYFLDYDFLKVVRLINKKYKSLVTIEALCVTYIFKETGTNLYKIFIKRMNKEDTIKMLEKKVKHYVKAYAKSPKCVLPIPDVIFSDNLIACLLINESKYEGGLDKLKKISEDFNTDTNVGSYRYTIQKADVIQYILFTSKPEFVYFIANDMSVDMCTIFDEVFLQLKKVEVDFEKGRYSLETIEPLTKFYVYKIAESPIPVRSSTYIGFSIRTNIDSDSIYAANYFCGVDEMNDIYHYSKCHNVIMSNGNLISCSGGNIYGLNF